MPNLNKDYYLIFLQQDYDGQHAMFDLRYKERDKSLIRNDEPISKMASALIMQEQSHDWTPPSGGRIGDAHEWKFKFIFHNKYREHFFLPQIYGLQVYPANLVSINDDWHSEYFLLHFHKFIDCIDYEASEFKNPEDIDEAHPELYAKKFVLNSAKLEEYPEEERLAFRIGGKLVRRPHLFHKKLVNKLIESGIQDVRFYPLDAYQANSEFLTPGDLRFEDNADKILDFPYSSCSDQVIPDTFKLDNS